MAILEDEKVSSLIQEPKSIPGNWRSKLHLRKARYGAHRERELEVTGDAGGTFKIIVRDNPNLLHDFSVVLLYLDNETTAKWRLRRYNGNTHCHTNIIEFRNGVPMSRFGNKFHIHICTKRYQMEGHKEDHFAEVTERYSDLEGAISCLLTDCGFIIEDSQNPQLRMGF